MHSILERVAAEEEEESDGHYQEEEEGGAHSLKDVCDLRRPAPSPFSSRRVMFENEQVKGKCERAVQELSCIIRPWLSFFIFKKVLPVLFTLGF